MSAPAAGAPPQENFRGTIDAHLSVGDAYNKYCVWKAKPGHVFQFTADKKWYWLKKYRDVVDEEAKALGRDEKKKEVYYVVGELKGIDAKTKMATFVEKGSVDEMQYPERHIEAYRVNDGSFDGKDDCAQLTHLSDASVLHNLRVRFDCDVIYTYSGLFCVALNPYRFFPIYTPGMVKHYQGQRRIDRAPHVYAMAEEAYQQITGPKGESQSMLVTGESGAGKTENTKKIIQYLAFVAGHQTATQEHGQLEDQLISANPLLEALGNAKTKKNHNSSRFGKFIKINFGSNNKISGASIVSYLLEKSRVCFQGEGERNFHIFYQLLEAYPGKSDMGLTNLNDYDYLVNKQSMVVMILVWMIPKCSKKPQMPWLP